MRRGPTEAEDRLWQSLRRDSLGVRFRRQVVIDRFIADFYCAARGVVVEVDGAVHLVRRERDAERDRIFAAMGLRVVRVRNEEVLLDLDAVVSRIEAALRGSLFSLCHLGCKAARRDLRDPLACEGAGGVSGGRRESAPSVDPYFL